MKYRYSWYSYHAKQLLVGSRISDFFDVVFAEMVTESAKDRETVEYVLMMMERYLLERLDEIAQPVLRLLEQKGEIIHDNLKTHFSEI
ncbi:MAG: hypothetical protein EAX81_06815 [Candidatus Thorarchaeota archaeon]|nr:hypothetical protein [Candidatus Thorarchaeota archaeon]